MEPKIRVLLLEDSDDDAEMLRRELRKAGLNAEICRVETESAYREQLRAFSPRIVLADLALPRYDGRLALRLLREESPGTPFILVSGSRGEELAIEALKQGATDSVLKHRLERLGPAAPFRISRIRRKTCSSLRTSSRLWRCRSSATRNCGVSSGSTFA